MLHCPPRGTTTQTKVIPWEIQVPPEWPEPTLTEEQQAIRDALGQSAL
ncbi:hypothetical protein MAHJHV54_19550 [Mycobacterium avium subsp. hominissuis]